MLKNGALNIYAYGSYAQECFLEICHHCEFDRPKVVKRSRICAILVSY